MTCRITLYGTARSRASRSLIALEELGVQYKHVPLFLAGDTPEARATLAPLNPNDHVPVLDDDGFVLWESMAINLYLAEKFARPPLWPATPRERGLVCQWSFWCQTEMDRPEWAQAKRSGDPARKAEATRQKIAKLAVLEGALAERAYLLGDAFSFADLNVAATLSQPNENGKVDWDQIDPSEHGLPRLGDWLKRCTTRDSWRRVRETRS